MLRVQSKPASHCAFIRISAFNLLSDVTVDSNMFRREFYCIFWIIALANLTFPRNSNSTSIEPLQTLNSAVLNFMNRLTKCTIRFAGNLSQEIDYFIENGSPIILDNLHIYKYGEIYNLHSPVQWQRNIFYGIRYERCSAVFFDWNLEQLFHVLPGLLANGRQIPDYFVIKADSIIAVRTAINGLRFFPIPTKYIVLSANFSSLSYLCMHCSKSKNILMPITSDYDKFARLWRSFHSNLMATPIYTNPSVVAQVYLQKSTQFCNNYKKEIRRVTKYQKVMMSQPDTCILANIMDIHNTSFSSYGPFEIGPRAKLNAVSHLYIKAGAFRILSNSGFGQSQYKVTLVFSKNELRLATISALRKCMDTSTWICALTSMISVWIALICLYSDNRNDLIRLLLYIYGSLVSNSCSIKQGCIIVCVWFFACLIIQHGFAGILFSFMTKLVSPTDFPKSYKEVMDGNYMMITTVHSHFRSLEKNGCAFNEILNGILIANSHKKYSNLDDIYKQLNVTVKCIVLYKLIDLLADNSTTFGSYFAIVKPELSYDQTTIVPFLEEFLDKVILEIDELPDEFSTWLGYLALQNFIPEVISPTISSFYESGISNLWAQRKTNFDLVRFRRNAILHGKFLTKRKNLNNIIFRKIGNLPHIFDPQPLPVSLDLFEKYFIWYFGLLGICLLVFCMEFTLSYFFTFKNLPRVCSRI